MDVWSFITRQHGSDSAVITESSTHNERIEHLWRDYFRSVGSLFHDTFQALEADNKLDPLNEVDLHYVYLSRINSAIDTFMESWNNHRISTAGNLTPNQLFVQGAIAHDRFPQYPVVPSSHFTSPLPHGNAAVALPRCSFCPCNGLLHYLTINVDPLQLSQDFGCSVYLNVCNIVGQHLQNCNSCYMSNCKL